jgi:hypothetical protein
LGTDRFDPSSQKRLPSKKAARRPTYSKKKPAASRVRKVAPAASSRRTNAIGAIKRTAGDEEAKNERRQDAGVEVMGAVTTKPASAKKVLKKPKFYTDPSDLLLLVLLFIFSLVGWYPASLSIQRL